MIFSIYFHFVVFIPATKIVIYRLFFPNSVFKTVLDSILMIMLSLNFIIDLEFAFICYLLWHLLLLSTSLMEFLSLFTTAILIILKVSLMFINLEQFNFTILNWMHSLQCLVTSGWFILYHFSFHWHKIFAYFYCFASWNA